MQYSLTNLTQSIQNLPEKTLLPNTDAQVVSVSELSAAAKMAILAGYVKCVPAPQTEGTPAPDAPVTQALVLAAGVAAMNLDLGLYADVTLDANVTVSNPTYSAQSRYKGLEITYVFVKSAVATQFTFTWGNQFKATTITAASATVSAKQMVKFMWDGAYWVQTAVSAAYV